MKVDKKDLEKSQVELNVELSVEEFKPFIDQGSKELSKEVEIEGFRKGHVPTDVLKRKVGEMAILEQAARIAVNKTIDKAITDNVEKQPVGQPRVDITKLAPGEPMSYKLVLATLPDVTLGEYKGLDVEKQDVKIEDSEIDKTLKMIQESRASEVIADKKIENGDKVIANIEMFLDKVPVEGGQSKDTTILIGKDYFVPGFDKKIIGMKKGDVREFELPYPKEHHLKNLAGKMVEFKVEVKEVYERKTPEINDEFAKTLGMKNVENLKETLKDNLKQEKSQEVEQKYEIEIIEKIVNNSEFSDIPELLVENETNTMLAELEQGVTNQGGKFEDYLSSIGKSKDDLRLEMAPNAVKRIKSALLIKEIAEKEKIEASEKEVDEKVEELLKQYKGYEKVEERVKEPGYKSYLANVITNQKAVAKLKEWNLKGAKVEKKK